MSSKGKQKLYQILILNATMEIINLSNFEHGIYSKQILVNSKIT